LRQLKPWHRSLVAVTVAGALLSVGVAHASAAFPGGNGLIAYSAGTPLEPFATNAYEIGANLVPKVLPCPEPKTGPVCQDFGPAYSPDGRRLALASGGGEGRLVLSMADGSGAAVLPLPPGSPREPAWAPKARSIAYTESGDAIWTIATDGTGARFIASEARQPAWSTRGWIAFTGGRGEGQICRVRPDGSRRRCLTKRFGEQPNWSPHGTRLAFQRLVRDRRGQQHWGVYTMRADGTGLRRLNSHGEAMNPAWSPDGKWIAFVRGAARTTKSLYRIMLNGTGLRRLAKQPNLADPDWQPRN
jgi:Tol biopolymer transport system component